MHPFSAAFARFLGRGTAPIVAPESVVRAAADSSHASAASRSCVTSCNNRAQAIGLPGAFRTTGCAHTGCPICCAEAGLTKCVACNARKKVVRQSQQPSAAAAAITSAAAPSAPLFSGRKRALSCPVPALLPPAASSLSGTLGATAAAAAPAPSPLLPLQQQQQPPRPQQHSTVIDHDDGGGDVDADVDDYGYMGDGGGTGDCSGGPEPVVEDPRDPSEVPSDAGYTSILEGRKTALLAAPNLYVVPAVEIHSAAERGRVVQVAGSVWPPDNGGVLCVSSVSTRGD